MLAFSLRKCPSCGKVFVAKPGKTHCARCTSRRLEYLELIEEALDRGDVRDPEAIARVLDIPLETVAELIEENPFLQHKTEKPRRCKRCREEPAQAGSNYCLSCRLALNQDLGNAAADVLSRVRHSARQLGGPVRSGRVETASILGERRRRGGPSETRLTPKNRWSP